MKKQKSITQFTVAADNPVTLYNGNSNDRPIAVASSSVNSSNNLFEKLYQPDQTYRTPKSLLGKRLRPFRSAWFTLYIWLHYQPESDTVICYICAKHNRNVVVITTAQLHSTKPELRFCAGSNPAREVSEIRDGEDL